MSTTTNLASLTSRFARPGGFEAVKNVLFVWFFFTHSVKLARHLRARGVVQSVSEVWSSIVRSGMLLMLRTPALKKKVAKELGEAQITIDNKLLPKGPNVVHYTSLPSEGRTAEWISAEMARMDEEMGNHSNWQNGKLSGAVYHGGADMEDVIVDAFKRYCVSNPLHPDVFPPIRKMEAEIVAMCLRMYNNPSGAGTTTSGGTESIIMSVKTHRDWAREVKGITEPEIVVPKSAHAAFDKAAAYLKIKVHTIPVDPETRQVDLRKVKRAINGNTIMVVGSAVNFPDGCMDDIASLSALAKKYNVGLHIDCCLGSFIVPFLEKAGFEMPVFDFRLEGVTAISCDTHKYGFAPKGSSVIMYRNAALRRHQYYVTSTWPGGLYGSPSMAGSRPGALIAGTWAAMQYMGERGYINSCKEIVGAKLRIEAAVRSDTEFPDLYVLGNPPASVVAFGSKKSEELNVLAVGDLMSKKGWHLNALNTPAALHIACTRLTVPVVDTFIEDLKECVREAKGQPAGDGTMVAVYGLGNSSAVGPTMVGKLAEMFLDAMYKA